MKIRVSLTQQELQQLAADYIARKTGLAIGQVEEFTLEYHCSFLLNIFNFFDSDTIHNHAIEKWGLGILRGYAATAVL